MIPNKDVIDVSDSDVVMKEDKSDNDSLDNMYDASTNDDDFFDDFFSDD